MSQIKTISVKNLSGLPSAAKEVVTFAQNKKIYCFYGELGAGKTTLIKELCKILGTKDPGSSPTYGLVNEYSTGRENKIYHFDFYRIKNETEAFDMGFEEYLDSTHYCFIEWPEKVERLLPQDVVRVRIAVQNSERIITLES